MGATVRNLDFTDVKDGGNFNPRKRPAGDYKGRIVKVDDHTSKEGNDMWVFTVTAEGDKRATYPIYVGTDTKQLWKARKLFMAAGLAVPQKRVKADPNKLVGKHIGMSLEDDEYEGRVKSVIQDFFPVTELETGPGGDDDVDDVDDDEADDEPTPAKKAPAKKAPAKKIAQRKAAPVEEDEEDEEDEEEPPPPPKKKARAKPEPEPEDDDEDDEDEEEEPAPRKKTKAAPVKTPIKKRRPEPDDDEDDDLDVDEL